jgi:hypothetical protein
MLSWIVSVLFFVCGTIHQRFFFTWLLQNWGSQSLDGRTSFLGQNVRPLGCQTDGFQWRHHRQLRIRCCRSSDLRISWPGMAATVGRILKWLDQGILKGEVWLYHWPPVWLVRNQLYDNWQFLFLFGEQNNPNQSNRRSMVQWYFPLYYSLIRFKHEWD